MMSVYIFVATNKKPVTLFLLTGIMVIEMSSCMGLKAKIQLPSPLSYIWHTNKPW